MREHTDTMVHWMISNRWSREESNDIEFPALEMYSFDYDFPSGTNLGSSIEIVGLGKSYA